MSLPFDTLSTKNMGKISKEEDGLF